MLGSGLGFEWNSLWSPQSQKRLSLLSQEWDCIIEAQADYWNSRACTYEDSHLKASFSSYCLPFSNNISSHHSLWKRGWTSVCRSSLLPRHACCWPASFHSNTVIAGVVIMDSCYYHLVSIGGIPKNTVTFSHCQNSRWENQQYLHSHPRCPHLTDAFVGLWWQVFWKF